MTLSDATGRTYANGEGGITVPSTPQTVPILPEKSHYAECAPCNAGLDSRPVVDDEHEWSIPVEELYDLAAEWDARGTESGVLFAGMLRGRVRRWVERMGAAREAAREAGKEAGRRAVEGGIDFRPKRIAHLYFVENPATSLIKIGVSVDTPSRLRALEMSAGTPLRLLASLPGYAEYERPLHAAFSERRACGEWFTACDEIRDLAANPLRIAALLGGVA